MTGMMGDEINDDDGNVTQQMMMGMMGQQMTSDGGMENMTESVMQSHESSNMFSYGG